MLVLYSMHMSICLNNNDYFQCELKMDECKITTNSDIILKILVLLQKDLGQSQVTAADCC